MDNSQGKEFNWEAYSKVIILFYCLLQVLRWSFLPQFMDIYYHLLTAWGFIQSGGYSGWDFWQYAPVGRAHIYPPVFHIMLAAFMKLGIDTVLLAKLLETLIPIAFLISVWDFVRKAYGSQLAFFTLIAFSSSFPFHLSLTNHLPATVALIFIFLGLSALFKGKYLRLCLLFGLCFYTHIGIAWFGLCAIFIYGLIGGIRRKAILTACLAIILIALPELFKQVISLRHISALGINLNEKYMCRVKIAEYILLAYGLYLIVKSGTKYRIFLSLFLAGFLFLLYPYRFFSGEGYLPVIFLSALAINNIYEKIKDKKRYIRFSLFLLFGSILLISPTMLMRKSPKANVAELKRIELMDSVALGLLLARGETVWLPQEYRSAAALIKENSDKGDIVYCTIDFAGVALAALSQRFSANGLLAEVRPMRSFDPFEAARIVVFAKDDDPDLIYRASNDYNLTKIGENRIFILYKNNSSASKVAISKPSVHFWQIGLITFVLLGLFLADKSA